MFVINIIRRVGPKVMDSIHARWTKLEEADSASHSRESMIVGRPGMVNFFFFFFDCPTQFGIRTVPRLVNPNDAGSYGVVASPHLKRRSVFGSQPTRFSWGKKSINLPEYASIDPRGRRAE